MYLCICINAYPHEGIHSFESAIKRRNKRDALWSLTTLYTEARVLTCNAHGCLWYHFTAHAAVLRQSYTSPGLYCADAGQVCLLGAAQTRVGLSHTEEKTHNGWMPWTSALRMQRTPWTPVHHSHFALWNLSTAMQTILFHSCTGGKASRSDLRVSGNASPLHKRTLQSTRIFRGKGNLWELQASSFPWMDRTALLKHPDRGGDPERHLGLSPAGGERGWVSEIFGKRGGVPRLRREAGPHCWSGANWNSSVMTKMRARSTWFGKIKTILNVTCDHYILILNKPEWKKSGAGAW